MKMKAGGEIMSGLAGRHMRWVADQFDNQNQHKSQMHRVHDGEAFIKHRLK